ncbi:MAG: LPD7 domain-containing protein [Methylocystis sp.]|uniref:LPD7 domain-containing protein n=1 Tax=Methylocystis sp. TaxID=1911079 RepID=UPI003DA23A40
MTTLAALDLSILTEGLQRRLAAKNRAALDDLAAAVQSAERYRAQTANSSRAAPRPGHDGRPDTGPRAPAPGEKSRADDELRVKRAVAAKGSVSQTDVSAHAPAAVAHTARPSSPALGGRVPATGAAIASVRSALIAKANLAAGSQAAVVKIASFGSGAARAKSLLNYQSDKGELTLERHDGLMITGQRSVADFAATWRAEDGRAPSNDVLQFEMRFDRRLETTEAQDALAEALRGHHYAWRLSQHGAHSRVDIVMTAASRERNAGGRLQRIYDNQRSIDGLRDRLEGAFGRDAEFTDPKWAHGVEGATSALARLTRGGEIDAYGPDGRALKDEAERLTRERPNRPPRAASREANISLEIAKSWRPHMRSSAPRDFAHVILSAKPGTDKEAFMDAARATLAHAFAGHEYVFVMHTNREHIHVHAAVRLVRDDGKRLDPKIQDFSRWRDTLAAEARARGIAMENVRRFDQAHAPAYKLKDVKMMARGIAPASVRRRVECVQNREIHRPTREEGRRRAQDAARQWRNVAALSPRRSPPPAPDAVRLYRLDSGGGRPGALFAADLATAAAYAKPGVATRMIYVDVPPARATELKSSRTQPGKVFVVPRAISAQSRPLDGALSAAVAHFQQRAESALRGRAPSTDAEETGPMRTAETMIAARDSMADTITKIDKALPDDEARAQFAEQSRRLLDKADEAIAAQTNLEQQKADVQGDRYVKPEPARDLGPIITFERKGDEIHYHRHDATGALQTLAFVDNGKQLDIRDWNNADSVNAALKVASEKWETLNITGSDAYKETVARLAAEHGYKITNPEMQGRIRDLRAEIEIDRARIAEGQAQPDERHEAAPMERRDKRDEPARAEGPTSTAAEREIRLQEIRGRVDREAARETEQAARTEGANKTNAVQVNEPSPYRSQAEAASAREADRSMEDNNRREMPADPRQSEQMQNLREQQSRVLKQDEEQRRVDQENAARINRELAQPRRPEGEGESR